MCPGLGWGFVRYQSAHKIIIVFIADYDKIGSEWLSDSVKEGHYDMLQISALGLLILHVFALSHSAILSLYRNSSVN